MILDLNNLSINQLNKFKKLSIDIQLDFNNLINQIQENNKGLVYMLTNVCSRNNYQSDLYLNCVKALFMDQEIKNNTKISKVIVYNKTLYFHLKKSISHILISYKKNKKDIETNFFFKPYFNLIKIFRNVIILLFTKNSKRNKKIINSKYVYIIDTFFIKNTISNKKYIDRYYNNLLSFCSESTKEKIFFCPTIIPKFNSKILTNIQNKSVENIIYKHDFLQLTDYLKSLSQIFKQNLKGNNFFLRNIDVSELISRTHRLNKYNYITYDALLNYHFVNRLQKTNIIVKTFIDWNENQSIDKGLIKGFRDFYPTTKIKSYQGMILSYDFNFHLCPTDKEIDNGVIADEIIVIGKKLISKIKKFSSNISVSSGPAFRFQGLFNLKHDLIQNQNILVILPIEIDETIKIINLLDKIVLELSLKPNQIKFKLHPTNDLFMISDKILSRQNYEFVDGNLSSIISSYSLIIGNSSSALMESLLYAVPVVVLPSFSGLSHNPIPTEIDNKIWSLCENEYDIHQSINRFLNMNLSDKLKLKKISKQIKIDYFAEPTTNNVNFFLND